MLKGKNILIGVSGGIASYKIASLISNLRKREANVKVIMTKSATEFITPLTLQTMSNNVVHVDMFNQLFNMDVEHISLAKWSDIFLIAPATANIIGKMANGIADDMLSTVYMASRCTVLVAPAMNTVMLNAQATQENLTKLKNRANIILPTEEDVLACGDKGSGKMISPEDILDYIDYYLTDKDYAGKKVLVTAGPTQESIDPVRFLSNHSTGKMGYAIAWAAKKRGAEVILISGPTNLKKPLVDKIENVTTTQEMFDAFGKYFDDVDVVIKSAAPADYRPKVFHEDKVKKTKQNDMKCLELEENPDIIKHYAKNKTKQIVVGFAAESTNIYEYAKGKLESKNLDMIVVNNIKKKDAGFGTDTNIASIIDANSVCDYEKMTKLDLADKILDRVKNLWS